MGKGIEKKSYLDTQGNRYLVSAFEGGFTVFWENFKTKLLEPMFNKGVSLSCSDYEEAQTLLDNFASRYGFTLY